MRIFCLFGLFAFACGSNGLPGGSGGPPGGNPPPSTPTMCGGKTGAACAHDQWCDFPDGHQCGNFDEPGTCVKRPEACPENFAPVCGCDGITYDNACLANGAGVDIAFDGPCQTPPPGKVCGVEGGGACAADEFCYFTPGQMCDWVDGTGTCKKRPGACTDNLDPVCGCDSKNYGNECTAAASGVGVAYYGKCGQPISDCRNKGCASGQTCQLCWTSYVCLDSNTAC